MTDILAHVELTDTFNKQRQVINTLIDYRNGNPTAVAGDGINNDDGLLSVRKTGDALTFDANGNLVGNDAYPDLLTQVVVDPDGPSTVPVEFTSTTVKFPAFKVIFDNKVYYGKKLSDFTVIEVPETTMTVESGADGAVFVYVDNLGEIHQTLNQISPENSSTQCLLGSYFRLNNEIQEDSWAYTPWNGATSKDNRFATGGSIQGGLIRATSTNTLSRMSSFVILEGVNISTNIYNPNKITYNQKSPLSTKELWPGYDASVLESTTLDTTHIYNMSADTVDDISDKEGYIILIPGIVGPTGQDVYLMAMSEEDNGNYNQIYSTMEEAASSLYGYQVSLGNVASRVLWLGQSLIVKIGATDYTSASQFEVIGTLPNVLTSYSSTSSGAAGSRVSGITIKDDDMVVGNLDVKTVINFKNGFSVLNPSENEAVIYNDIVAANQMQVNEGLDDYTYISPATLKNQNYLATIEYVDKILQQTSSSNWPVSTDPNDWPHTIILTQNESFSLPVTQPTFTDKILTWEVVIRNNSNMSIVLTWPNVYQAFNNETLPTILAPNTSLFMMMRRYSNNYTLVSIQGRQSSSLI